VGRALTNHRVPVVEFFRTRRRPDDESNLLCSVGAGPDNATPGGEPFPARSLRNGCRGGIQAGERFSPSMSFEAGLRALDRLFGDIFS
jgi:hypothetical protein